MLDNPEKTARLLAALQAAVPFKVELVPCCFLLTAFLVTAGPLSSIQLPPINAFVPAYTGAMFVNDSSGC
jgi:hypothetical protein